MSVKVSAKSQAAQTSEQRVRFSEVISALSFALDITEGQPEGHAVRSCIIGVHIAQKIGLSEQEREALFYALLLKDLGCSSNAARVCWLFQADDINVKCDFKLIDWTDVLSRAKFALGHAFPQLGFTKRLFTLLGMARGEAETNRELIKVRCERGADITRMLGLPEATAQAILGLDEHYDGQGHPLGLEGDEIPLAARICCLAQTMEVFIASGGIGQACQVARRRSGKWFDPELVKVFLQIAKDSSLAQLMTAADPREHLRSLEPPDLVRDANESGLDRIALAFSHVIDAKTPWTLRHSEGVAEIAAGIAETMGHSLIQQQEIRRAGLLHDIGKLGVSNLILDKAGKLTDKEFQQMRSHSLYSQQILSRVSAFGRFADYASAHHERMDGKGYHRGLQGQQIALEARILAVADVCEALAADRPYRDGLPPEKILNIIESDSGTAFCPEVVDAFLQYQDASNLFARLKARSAPEAHLAPTP